MSTPEILAPAGSMQALEAAVRAGADAVYLGGRRFSARQGAANFSDGALGSAVAYCRLRGVRAYLAVNTLLYGRELSDALALCRLAAYAGVDAFILQDLGLLKLLKSACSVPVHASTQMTVHSPAGIAALSKMGFSRAVLARELSLKEIEPIAEAARLYSMELEVFVHGALCMSVSGQCYFSAMLGRRSGNRGLCAQPCRLPYSCGGRQEYLLSLKDLSAADQVLALKSLGVRALKIEGRMKSPEYVAACTHTYRLTADGEKLSPEDMENLRAVFSRSGFTNGYLTGQRQKMFGYRRAEDLQDTSRVLNTLHGLYRHERQKVEISMRLNLQKDYPARLSVTDGNHKITAEGQKPETALNKALRKEAAQQKLTKTGGTPYIVTGFDCTIEPGLTLSSGALGELKRRALAELSERRSLPPAIPFKMPDISALTDDSPNTNYSSENPPEPAFIQPRLPALRVRFASADQISGGLPEGLFSYIPLSSDFKAAVHLVETGAAFGIELPRLIFTAEDAALKRLCEWKHLGAQSALCHTLSAIELARRAGLIPHGGIFLNIFNTHALNTLKELDVWDAALSFELPLNEIKKIHPRGMRLGIAGYGYLPLMITRSCPLSVLKNCSNCQGRGIISDRKGIEFAVKCNGGTSEIYNSRRLWMADRMEKLIGLDFLLLHFTTETADECNSVIHAYKTGGDPPPDFTRGLYYRGVL